ncbi:MAG: glycosyltransferase family 4 protein [Crocinitomicaceae bacterium]|nr:glycosyltransferase family 4 protein [Crocinitomicaceae bacterium]
MSKDKANEGQKKRIVFVCGWYSDQFGYIHNNLPKALAKAGADVHILTSNSNQYSTDPNYEETYQSFLGEKYVEAGTYVKDGVTIHRLPYKQFRDEVHFKFLKKNLKELRPYSVHIFDVGSYLTFKLAFYKLFLGYKFITSNHILLSVFPLAKNWKTVRFFKRFKWNLLHKFPGRFVYKRSDLIIYPTVDAKEVAVGFFGFKDKKSVQMSLAVDTDVFCAKSNEENEGFKNEFGFEKDDFICTYTGRFSEDKNPLVLAKAITLLQKDYPKIKGLFVGSGVQQDRILSETGCSVHPFVNQEKLTGVYSMSGLGVWPRQESTSMLDCIACGTPIILNDTIKAVERVDGNGYLYKMDDHKDLAEKILSLYQNPSKMEEFSQEGRKKVTEQFSWKKYATDYLAILNKL